MKVNIELLIAIRISLRWPIYIVNSVDQTKLHRVTNTSDIAVLSLV